MIDGWWGWAGGRERRGQGGQILILRGLNGKRLAGESCSLAEEGRLVGLDWGEAEATEEAED